MTSVRTSLRHPESDIDLWTDEALLAPYELWRELRELGPAVWLRKYDLWAFPRYREVREAVGNWEVFSSAQGISLNEVMNEVLRGVTICTDPPEHEQLRRVLRKPLAPAELRALAPEIEAEAERLVERLVADGSFDAATELAQHLPLTIVSRQVGLPHEGRENMLKWASAGFNCNGPLNDRTKASFPALQEAVEYMSDPTLRERVTPGGWAARLWEATNRGELDEGKAEVLLADYWAPSLDTTILATASAIWLFGRYPDQWKILRSEPALIGHAVNEVLRLEPPLPHFSRVTTREVMVDGVTVPAGSRVLLMYGSANRDERKWQDPERFDVRRKPSDHLAFGNGEHRCVGQALARLEIKALLIALVKRVEHFELGESERVVNNWARGFTRLEVKVH